MRISLFPIIIIVFLIPLNEPLKRDITQYLNYQILFPFIIHQSPPININQKRFPSRISPFPIIIIMSLIPLNEPLKWDITQCLNYQILFPFIIHQLPFININQKRFLSIKRISLFSNIIIILNSFKRTIKTRYYEININYQISSPFIITNHLSLNNINQKRFPSRISLFPIITTVFLIPLNEPLKRDITKLTSIIKFHLLSSLTNHSTISIKKRLIPPLTSILTNPSSRSSPTLPGPYASKSLANSSSSLTNSYIWSWVIPENLSEVLSRVEALYKAPRYRDSQSRCKS